MPQAKGWGMWQEGFLLAFINKQLCNGNLGKSTYEKETLVILHAFDVWHLYLMGNRFQIKANHCSLKYFLE
jgi:hypothetical protein